jgi:hypothetical protein
MKKVGGGRSVASLTSFPSLTPLPLNQDSNNVPIQYPNRCTLYLDPPDYEIDIEEFENLAISRLECKNLSFSSHLI